MGNLVTLQEFRVQELIFKSDFFKGDICLVPSRESNNFIEGKEKERPTTKSHRISKISRIGYDSK